MPIKGVSDQFRLSRGGHLRLGTRSQEGYPVKSDHFIFESDNPDIVEQFKSVYGDKPKRITIRLVSEDPFPHWYKCWGASKKHCQGDGETALRLTDDGNRITVPCPSPLDCEFSMSKGRKGKPGCAMQGMLQCLVFGLSTWSVIQISTGSFHSIVNINSTLSLLRQNNVKLAGQWLDLVLRNKQVEVNGKKTTIYCLHLEPPTRKPVGDDHLLPDYSAVAPEEFPPHLDDAEDDVPVVPATTTPTAAPTGGLDDDPEVQAAIAKLSPAIGKALLNAAKEYNWTKKMVLDKAHNATPGPSAPPQEPIKQPLTQELSPKAKDDRKAAYYDSACAIAQPIGGKEAVDQVIYARGVRLEDMTWEEMDEILAMMKDARQAWEDQQAAKQPAEPVAEAAPSAPAPADPGPRPYIKPSPVPTQAAAQGALMF